jgi:hypothetical protein
MTERWLPVAGYEDSYEVSDQGRVRSLTRSVRCGSSVGQILGRELKPFPSGKRQYPTVKLSRDGSKTAYLIHRLMLEAFVGPCPKGLECCHDNDVATDNRLENLRWGTRSSNMLDVVKNGNHNQANKTKCDYGHEFTPENTIARFDGRRGCRACKNRSQREAYAAGRDYVRPWNRRAS